MSERIPSTTPPHRSAEGVTGHAEDVAASRAAAMLPAELLQPNEIIVLLLKPSPWFILLAPLGTLAMLCVLTLALIVLNMYAPLGVSRNDLTLLGIALVGARLFWQFLEWLSRVYVLTDQRLIRVRGVIRIHIFECPLRQVQHTRLLFNLRERFFGLGTISFATAGTDRDEAWWTMIPRPLDTHRIIVQTLRRYRR